MQAQSASRRTGFGRSRVWLAVAVLVTPMSVSMAQGTGQTSDVAEDEVMQGFPPPPDRQVSRGNGLRPTYMRWAFRHAREMSSTVGIRHASQPLALSGRPGTELDATTFAIAGNTVRLADYLRDTHTDGFIVLHRG